MSATDGVTLYRKTIVAANDWNGEPVILMARQGTDRFYTIINEPWEHGEMLIDFDRDRQALIERAVAMANWHVSDIIARGVEIKRVMTVGFAP